MFYFLLWNFPYNGCSCIFISSKFSHQLHSSGELLNIFNKCDERKCEGQTTVWRDYQDSNSTIVKLGTNLTFPCQIWNISTSSLEPRSESWDLRVLAEGLSLLIFVVKFLKNFSKILFGSNLTAVERVKFLWDVSRGLEEAEMIMAGERFLITNLYIPSSSQLGTTQRFCITQNSKGREVIFFGANSTLSVEMSGSLSGLYWQLPYNGLGCYNCQHNIGENSIQNGESCFDWDSATEMKLFLWYNEVYVACWL